MSASGVFSLVGAFIMLFYPISKQKYKAIQAAIAQHAEVMTHECPATVTGERRCRPLYKRNHLTPICQNK